MPTVTMQDIAGELGVSLMTVSRALRGVGRISEATRTRVRATARRLGYVSPQDGVLGAPAHRGTSDHRLRLMLPVFGDGRRELRGLIARELLAGLRQRLAVNGGDLMPVPCAGLDDLLDAWDERGATGLVLRRQLPSAWLRVLRERGPVVYATSHDFAPGVDAAYANELRAAAGVVDGLRLAGHREVAWFRLHDVNSPDEVQWPLPAEPALADSAVAGIHGPRYSAWSYVAASEPRLTHRLIAVERDRRRERLCEVVDRELETLRTAWPGVTAIVCPNDFVAAMCVRRLPVHGRRVPADMSVISFGGTRIAAGTRPALTAVALPMHTIGRAIPDLVERRLAAPDAEPLTLLFEAPLRPGQTLFDYHTSERNRT